LHVVAFGVSKATTWALGVVAAAPPAALSSLPSSRRVAQHTFYWRRDPGARHVGACPPLRPRAFSDSEKEKGTAQVMRGALKDIRQ